MASCALKGVKLDMASCALKSEKTTLSWSLEVLSNKWPFLFTFVKDASHSVQDLINTDDAATLFHLPLSLQAMAEYHHFVQLVLRKRINGSC
jgi:hypothetical protein